VTGNTITAVDAHIHQWDLVTTPRVVSGPAKIVRRAPLMRPVLMRMFPRAARDFAGDPQYLLNRTIWALREILGDRFDENRMLRDNARRVYRI
jgi:hypothetical protein